MSKPLEPFRAIHADAWAAPADVPSLNKDVSDLILARIEEVRRAGAREDLALHLEPRILLLGPAGAGKTHLFTRLRAQAGRRAVFIHTRPQIGVEPTPRFVLRSILDSLRQRIAGGDEMQIDRVAGAILAAHQGDKPRFPLAKVERGARAALGRGAARPLRDAWSARGRGSRFLGIVLSGLPLPPPRGALRRAPPGPARAAPHVASSGGEPGVVDAGAHRRRRGRSPTWT